MQQTIKNEKLEKIARQKQIDGFIEKQQFNK